MPTRISHKSRKIAGRHGDSPSNVGGLFPAAIDVPPAAYIEDLGTVFANFTTQDSGNISYGVRSGDTRYFVKTAGDPADTRPYLDFAGRVALLRTAAELARSVTHPTMPALHALIESPAGAVLVYEWRDGDLLHDAPARERFRALPTAEILEALNSLYNLHAVSAGEWRVVGWPEARDGGRMGLVVSACLRSVISA